MQKLFFGLELLLWLSSDWWCSQILFKVLTKSPLHHEKQRHPTCVGRLMKEINCYSEKKLLIDIICRSWFLSRIKSPYSHERSQQEDVSTPRVELAEVLPFYTKQGAWVGPDARRKWNQSLKSLYPPDSLICLAGLVRNSIAIKSPAEINTSLT